MSDKEKYPLSLIIFIFLAMVWTAILIHHYLTIPINLIIDPNTINESVTSENFSQKLIKTIVIKNLGTELDGVNFSTVNYGNFALQQNITNRSAIPILMEDKEKVCDTTENMLISIYPLYVNHLDNDETFHTDIIIIIPRKMPKGDLRDSILMKSGNKIVGKIEVFIKIK